jgi:tRNA(adenine34) deaminase
MFSKKESEAIQEKLEQLGKVCDGIWSRSKLARIIKDRRVAWVKENINAMLLKYGDLNVEEQAFRIIYFEHMKINPDHVKMNRVSPKKIRIESHNFCPYLEACKQLKLDTKIICKEIGELSIQEMCKAINPKLKFSRNYKNIRPRNNGYCEEYIEVI